jgi:hypothetical protein
MNSKPKPKPKPKMVMLYRAPDATEAAVLAHALEAEGVAATQAGAATITYGELGREALQVDVWVSADDADDARKIIEAYYDRSERTQDQQEWTCSECGEGNGSSFEVCWQCQAPREGAGAEG